MDRISSATPRLQKVVLEFSFAHAEVAAPQRRVGCRLRDGHQTAQAQMG